MFWCTFLFITGLKLLLMGAYRSTDFEVHRNWMAITHSLPMSQWYSESTSVWTLDYPPFFAFFEWILSHIAKFFDQRMLVVSNLNYASDATILFQRLSVILTDLVYAFGVKKFLSELKFTTSFYRFAAGMILLCNVGLTFVDHIHFQYNGFLFGILLLSIGYLIEERYYVSCFLFAALLNFKHIYLYMAPAFGVFYLKFHCVQSMQPIRNLFYFLVAGLSCFAVSFGPFYRQMPQVLSRLFPFKRGLTHAYWAPNFWAIYNVGEKVASTLNRRGHQQHETSALPEIKPVYTFLLTFLFMFPCLIKLVIYTNKEKHVRSFMRAVILCACTSFMFGWHVHEKAILMALIPLCILAFTHVQDARYAFILSAAGYISLFPLLFPVELTLVKYSLFLAYISSTYVLLKSIHKNLYFHWYEQLYFLGFLSLPAYEYMISNLFSLNEKLPFMPLLLTSLYCSIGVFYTYFNYYFLYIRTDYECVEHKGKLKTEYERTGKLKSK